MSDSSSSFEAVCATERGDAAAQRAPASLPAVRLLVGGLFFVTAALKTLSPQESAALAVAYNIPPLLTATVVQIELMLAALLVFGCWTRQVLIASTILFGVFGAFSIIRGFAGFESCGCFGSLKVNPWLTAVLDGGMLAMAAWGAWKLAPSGERIQKRRLSKAGGCYALAAACGLTAHIILSPAAMNRADDAIVESDGLIVLDPEEWIGKSFPLTGYLNPEIGVHHGRWILLLYHHDCPDCQRALPQYERLAAGQRAVGSEQRIAIVETPPYAAASPHKEGIVYARLTDRRQWFVQTPVEIQLEDGVVVSASLDLPAATSGSLHVLSPSPAFTSSTYRRAPEIQRATAL